MTPTIREGAQALSAFLDNITEFISGTDDAKRSTEALATSLRESDATLERRASIQRRIEYLDEFIAKTEEAAEGSANLLRLRGRETRLGMELREAREEAELLRGVIARSPEAYQTLQTELGNLNTDLQDVQQSLREKSDELGNRTGKSVQGLRLEIERLSEQERQLKTDIEETTGAINSFRPTIGEFDEANKALIATTKSLVTETRNYTAAVRELTPFITSADQIFEVWTPSLESAALAVAGFTGEIEGVVEPFRAWETGLSSAAAEAEALDDVTKQLIQDLQDLEGLADAYENIDRNLDPHNANLVSAAVNEATESVRNYIDAYDDLDITFRSVTDISDMVTVSVREQASAFDELRGSVESVADAAPSDIFDRIDTRTPGTASGISQDNADVFENFQVGLQSIGFEFLREGAFQQNAEDIDTVGESVTAFGDILARVASGDLTALGDAVGRTFGIIEAQNEAFEQRRRQRRIDAIEERTTRAFRFGNLEAVGRVGGVDDIYSLGALGGFRQAVASGESQGIGLNIAGASDALNIDERIETSLLNLVANLDRAITGADIDAIYQPFLTSFETAMERAGANFEDVIDTDAPTQLVTDSFNTYLSSINTYFDLQIRNVRDQERATGVFLTETIRAIETARAGTLNAARLLDTTPNLTGRGFRSQQRIRGAQSFAESSGTDRQFTEDTARQQYGTQAYDAEVAAATATPEELLGITDLDISNLQLGNQYRD